MRNKKTKIIVALFIIVLILLQFSGLYTDWVWFGSINFGSIFTKTLLMQVLSGLLFSVIIFLVLFINLTFARKLLAKNSKIYNLEDENIEFLNRPYSVTDYISDFVRSKYSGLIVLVGSIIVAILGGFGASTNWIDFAKYFNSTSFDLADPLFGNDVGYYVFKLPFLTQLYSTIFGITLLTIAIVAIVYYFVGFLQKIKEDPNAKKTFNSAISHLSLLGAFTLLVKAFGFKLDIDQLMYSPRGVAFGASYTDVYASRPVLFISLGIAVIGGLLFIANIKLKKTKILIVVPIVLVVVSTIVSTIYPAIIQQFVVTPNELESESEFIRYNIDFTRKAYGLTDIKEENYPANVELTYDDIEENMDTVNNIRLHDVRPALDTYNQIEAIRPYYDFLDVDVDRYEIDGDLTQVMLSARELIPGKLDTSAQTWINQHLKYTHGQGIVVSPVNEISSQGLPTFFVNRIPPKSNLEQFDIKKPQLYFGEHSDIDYIITNTDATEVDYTSPDGPVEYNYTGDDGIKLNFLNKALYSVRLGTLKLFLNQDINPDSKLLMNRNILDRVEAIAPFLIYDEDPYIVVENNKLYWIIDAYTYTGDFPYSEPYANDVNYLNDSIKVVVDAYNGTTDFYLFDEQDPIAQTYKKIFPDLFTDFKEMPDYLKKHIRYPETLYKVQSEMLLHYHMTDVGNFFYKDDAWSIANEVFGQSGEVQVEPRHILMKLPGEDEVEFVLILPFTPSGRNNMISWLAARMDGDKYGEMVLYQFPRQEFINGPKNIENRIDQNTEISGQLSLWSQQGSQVIRGNLMVIPIADSILFVEPIYLQASSQGLPEIRRIIVAHGDKIVMERTFDEALVKLFSASIDEEDEDPIDEFSSMLELTEEAQGLYEEMDEAMRDGDWAKYGELQEELKEIIDRLVRQAGSNIEVVEDNPDLVEEGN
ncbi:MAG: UPF0182 family protein [Clostridia bacterium]